MLTILWSLCIGSKLKGEKFDKGALWNWLQINKNVILKCRLLIFYATMNHFSVELWCAKKKKVIVYDNSNDQLSSWTKKKPQLFPKPNLHQKRHSHCLVVCHQSDSLQLFELPGKPLHLRRRSANQWDAQTTKPAAGIDQQKGPSSSPWWCLTPCCTNNTSKLKNWAMKFCFICRIHLTSTTYCHFFIILKTFCRENASITSRTQKMLSRNPSNHESQIFMLQE